MLLGKQLWEIIEPLPVKPVVTIALLIYNMLIFVGGNPLGFIPAFSGGVGSVQKFCLHPSKILDALWHRGVVDWRRIVFPAFIHGDNQHLYYNMISFAYKGIHLEPALGAVQYSVLIAFSLVVSHVLTVLISYTLYAYVPSYPFGNSFSTCTVGFSAVIFALKYIVNHSSPTYSIVQGMSVPTKYAAWLELVLIYFVVPNSSFVGHFSGIVAGVLWLHGGDAVRSLITVKGRRQAR
jgi:rhomboid domain-containing protein 1